MRATMVLLHCQPRLQGSAHSSVRSHAGHRAACLTHMRLRSRPHRRTLVPPKREASAGCSDQSCPAAVVAMLKTSPSIIQIPSIMSVNKTSVNTSIIRTAVTCSSGNRARRSVSVQASGKFSNGASTATATAAPVKSCCEGSAAVAPADVTQSHKVEEGYEEYYEVEEYYEYEEEAAAPPILEQLKAVDYKGITLVFGGTVVGTFAAIFAFFSFKAFWKWILHAGLMDGNDHLPRHHFGGGGGGDGSGGDGDVGGDGGDGGGGGE